MSLKIFLDSDVIISSFISKTGAAFCIVNQTDSIDRFISNISVDEIKRVSEKLSLDMPDFQEFAARKMSILVLESTIKETKSEFGQYVIDINDAHIVAGAVKGKVQFLISYNIKHFKADKLKEDFNIILTTPANFLQYLRST